MPELVEVVFRCGGKVYSFDAGELELDAGDQVVVRTSRGVEIGRVVVANHEVPETEITTPLEKVIRKVTAADLAAVAHNEELAAKASQACQEKINEYGLDMRLINTEVVFDASKIVISFFAEERVDFRKLVEELVKRFKTRIEFRQVGVRDEARLIGGYGPCGRQLCCATFAGDQQPVSIKMAKEQNLPLNPMKISGICGRLMCCLKYEQEEYKCFKAKAPAKGSMVRIQKGEGKVIDYLVPKEKVLVDLGEGRWVEASLDELNPVDKNKVERAPKPERPRPERNRSERSRQEKPKPEKPKTEKPKTEKVASDQTQADQAAAPKARSGRSRRRKRP